MWPFCTANSPWWFLLPFLLGLLTGWWAWARYRAAGAVGAGGSVGGASIDAGARAPEPLKAPDASVSGDLSGGTVAGLAAGGLAAGAAVAGLASGDGDVETTAKATEPAPKPAPVPAAAPAAAPAPAPSPSGVGAGVAAGAGLTAIGIAAAVGVPDDLEKIKGIGPKLNGMLGGLGITRFDQIAAWSKDDVGKVDPHLKGFHGRIEREEWIPQARLLSTGQNAEWERIYGGDTRTGDSGGGTAKAKAAPKAKAAKSSGKAAGAVALTAIGIPAAVGAADDLEMIKGVGPKLNGMLTGLGITRFDQIAKWSKADVAKVDPHLENFSGRIEREEWIPQAKLLAAGKNDQWAKKYGGDTRVGGAAAAGGAVALTAIGIPAAVGAPDSLLQIKGVGPKLNDLLISLGITRFDQIAAWGAAEIDKVDDHLGNFKNRISRDAWVEQAGLLASGKIAEFEAKFGKLDSEN